jgi:hypothetical protein
MVNSSLPLLDEQASAREEQSAISQKKTVYARNFMANLQTRLGAAGLKKPAIRRGDRLLGLKTSLQRRSS